MHDANRPALKNTSKRTDVGRTLKYVPAIPPTVAIEPSSLKSRLQREFGGSSDECRVVVRQAVDLADSEQYEGDVGTAVTNDVVVEELADAPHGTPAERWNWWMGSLEVAYGGYGRFGIQRHRQ
jgi:hypothetical protein